MPGGANNYIASRAAIIAQCHCTIIITTAPIQSSQQQCLWQHLWYSPSMQLSYGSSTPSLSSTEKYPTFFRTIPSEVQSNSARLAIMQKFGWERVATLSEIENTFSLVCQLMHLHLFFILIILSQWESTQNILFPHYSYEFQQWWWWWWGGGDLLL